MDRKQVWNGILQILTGEVDKRSSKYVTVYFILISLLEILAYSKGGIYSMVAARIWIITFFLLFVIFCGYAVWIVYIDIKNKRYLLVVGILSLLAFLISFIGKVGYSDINADAAQQLAAGLESFEVPDWNYTGVAFLGYANRQYVLGALPALLFGRSIATLHMGFAGLFIIGLAMLYFEFRSWLKWQGLEETLALVPCYAMLAFRFIAEYYLNFEQAITPVAVTMIGIALFLRWYRKAETFTIMALTWVGCFCCDSYTPALAFLGLLVCFLLMHAWELYFGNHKAGSRAEAFGKDGTALPKLQVLSGSVMTMLFFFVATVLGSRQDRLTSVREEIEPFSFALEAWNTFFSEKYAVFFGIFLGIVLLYLLLALTFCLRFYDFVVAVWVFGVVLLASLLKGYTTYEKAWILQRNMVIIPVLVVAIFFSSIRIIGKHNIRIGQKSIAILLLCLAVNGFGNFGREHQSFNYFRYIQPMKYMLACAEDFLEEQNVSNESEMNIILVTDNVLQANLYDYAKFFYPNAYVCTVTTGEEVPVVDENRRTFVFSETGEALQEFEVFLRSRSYNNPRYHAEHTWYYGEVR